MAPRKLGSLEDWILGLAHEAHRRGHELTVFGHDPIHTVVREGLQATNARWCTVSDLTDRPLAGIRRLACDFDVIHMNLFAPRDRPTLLAYAAVPARVVFVDHFSAPDVNRSRYRVAGRKLLDWLVARRIAAYIGVSDYVRERARIRFGKHLDCADTIYDGVDVRRFGFVDGRPTRASLTIICVAHLIRDKGVDVLLRALARLDDPRLHLSIVGDGPEHQALEALASELGVRERVMFHGLRDDVDRLLQTADIFVHPARWHEAFGLGVAEAMGTGCPVVASKTGAMSELVEDGVSGLLVPPDDARALADALARLVADPRYRAELARRARQRVVERFRIEDSVRRHIDRCEQIAARSR